MHIIHYIQFFKNIKFQLASDTKNYLQKILTKFKTIVSQWWQQYWVPKICHFGEEYRDGITKSDLEHTSKQLSHWIHVSAAFVVLTLVGTE